MTTTYRATFSVFAWISWAAVLLVIGAVLLAAPKGLGWGALLLALIVSGVEAFFVQMAQCGISVRADGLTVRQPLTRVDLPWSQVQDVQVDDGGALTISAASGRDIPAFGFGGSLIGAFTGGIRAKRARDGILAAKRAAMPPQQDKIPNAPRITVCWPWAAATGLALELAALVGMLAH
jgi:hypothetical protein